MTCHDNTPSNGARRAIYERPKEADVVDPSITLDELISVKAVVSERISDIRRSVDSIKSQLESAKSRQAATGSYADHEWWIRANDALRHHGLSYQDHCRALGNINRRIKELSHERTITTPVCRERAFIDHARAVLPKETYMEIWSRVGIDRPELCA
jgi:hypothetical protein